MADKPPKLTARFFRDWLAPQWPWLALGFVFAAISAIAAFGYAQIIKQATDALGASKAADASANPDLSAVLYVPVIIIAMALVRGAAIYWQTQANNTAVQRALVKLQEALFGKLICGDFARLQAAASGEYVSQFANDMNLVREAALRVATNLAKSTLTVIAALAFMFWNDWVLALVLLVAYPLAFYPVVRLGERIRKNSTRSQEQAGALTSLLGEAFQGARTVKAFSLEGYQQQRASDGFNERARLYMGILRAKAIVDPFLEVIGSIALAGLFAFAGWRILSGAGTIGDLTGFITAIAIASPEVRALGTLNSVLGEGLAAAQRIYAVLDAPQSIVDAPSAQPLSAVKSHIEFEAVRFAYPDGSLALDGLSFTAEPGETVALVGPSGAGKSTVLNLLMRLYDASAGAVKVDGRNVREVQLASLRKSIALVGQDAFLFDDTIRQNIALGRPGASDAEIEAAAKAAACDFIDKLPQGWNSRAGEGGRNLSGGQRQRVALARALLSEAPILVLDEATSALDSDSEARVQEALAKLAGRRTILVIAHRLATVRRADRIHVLEHGRIVEAGRHDDLMAQSGLYARLAQQQLN